MKALESENANLQSSLNNETHEQARKSVGNRKIKILLFWLLLFAPIIVLFETSSYLIIKRTVPSRILMRVNGENSISKIIQSRQFADRPHIIQASATKNESYGSSLFHPALGWDFPPDLVYDDFAGVTFSHGPGGERRCLTNYDNTLISTYGDSFTYCAEVGDSATWQTALAEKLGTNALNYGVSGYGPDQALLKYELNQGPPTKVVILGVLPENVNRVVNIYRPFYTYTDTTMGTKPMFVKQGGTIRLVPNPIRSVADLPKLDEEQFLEELGKLDYWYQLDKKLPKFTFPYTLSFCAWKDVLFSHLAAGLGDISGQSCRHPWNLYDEDGPLGIMRYIADRFVTTARSRGSEPLIVIMPHKDNITEITDKRLNRVAPFLEYLSRKGYPFLDAVKSIADMKPSKQDLEKWYGSHATAEGNRVLADILSKRLRTDYSCFSGDQGMGASGSSIVKAETQNR
jgi:hypothetical protein